MTDRLNLEEVSKVHREAVLGLPTRGICDTHYGSKSTELRALMKEMRRAQ